MRLRRSQHPRGVALLSLVMTLAIIGVLSGMYFQQVQTPQGESKPWASIQIERARVAVCDANRVTARTTIIMDQMMYGGVQLTTDQMMDTARKLPRCPGEGRFFMESMDEVSCSGHTLTPKFRERLVG